ncbi:MAG: hypothetical protein HGA68_01195 [Methanothrix sp.]|jgi:hypothetical protein|nr:hypothetical protein [Methanothrix sp.]
MVKKLLGNYFKRYTPPLAAAGIKGMRIQLGFGSALGLTLNEVRLLRKAKTLALGSPKA